MPHMTSILSRQIKFGNTSYSDKTSMKATLQVKEPLGGATVQGRPRVAVVGGGAAGTSTFYQLVENSAKTGLVPDIDVIEASGRVGPGRNWDPNDGPSAKSNNAVGQIGVTPERQSDFATRYLGLPPERHGDYFERSDFGRYLEHSFNEMAGEASLRGAKIRVIPEMVDGVAIDERSARPLLHGETSRWGAYDAVILAPGNGRPVQPFAKPLTGLNYFHDPVPGAQKLARIASLPADHAGLVIGTSLSGIEAWRVTRWLEYEREAPKNIDFPTWLREHGRPMTIASRSGLAPVVEMPPNDKLDLRHVTEDYLESCIEKHGKITLEDFLGAVQADIKRHKLSNADIVRALSPKSSPEKQLAAQIDAIEGRNDSLRDSLTLLKKMARHDQVLWQYGDARLRELFQTYRPKFARVRGVIRPDFGRELLEACQGGRLNLVGGLVDVRNAPNRNGYIATFRSGEKKPAGFVINAATHGGVSRDYPLVANIIANKVGNPDGAGGVQVDFHTQRVIAPSGKPSPRVWAVGNITQGIHYDLNSVFRLANSAKRSVASLVSVLRHL